MYIIFPEGIGTYVHRLLNIQISLFLCWNRSKYYFAMPRVYMRRVWSILTVIFDVVKPPASLSMYAIHPVRPSKQRKRMCRFYPAGGCWFFFYFTKAHKDFVEVRLDKNMKTLSSWQLIVGWLRCTFLVVFAVFRPCTVGSCVLFSV